MKTLISIVLTFTLFLCIYFAIPYIWKACNGSFFWGEKGVVYKGSLLVETNEGCAFTSRDHFHEVKQYCPALDENVTVRTWIDGVELISDNNGSVIKFSCETI